MIIEHISRDSGVNVAALRLIVRTASKRYRTYTIPKRTGGSRTINHPTPALKYLQRWVARNVVAHFPVHDCATAFRKNIGIASNANKHVRNNYLLRIDFENFFPSLTSRDVMRVVSQHQRSLPFQIDKQDIQDISDIVCRREELTIGAPSSPGFSNLIMFEFDHMLDQYCSDHNIIYTRYADDIFLSTNEPNILRPTFDYVVQDLLARESPRLRINFDKTVFTSRKRKRMVTGLVLTPDKKISIGRQRKRYIRSLVHRYSELELEAEKISYLRGFLAFAVSVEPQFVGRLRNKYGSETIERLLNEKIVSGKYANEFDWQMLDD